MPGRRASPDSVPVRVALHRGGLSRRSANAVANSRNAASAAASEVCTAPAIVHPVRATTFPGQTPMSPVILESVQVTAVPARTANADDDPDVAAAAVAPPGDTLPRNTANETTARMRNVDRMREVVRNG